MVTLPAIRQQRLRVVRKFLDEAEDVVPAPAVEPRGVLAQFVENLVQLERGEDRLDQHGRLDGSAAECPAHPARDRKHRSTAALPDGFPSSADRNTGRCRGPAAPWRCGKNRGRSRRAIPTPALPSTRTWASSRCHPRGRTSKHRGLFVQFVGLLRCRVFIGDRAPHRVGQIDLAFDLIASMWAYWNPRNRP